MVAVVANRKSRGESVDDAPPQDAPEDTTIVMGQYLGKVVDDMGLPGSFEAYSNTLEPHHNSGDESRALATTPPDAHPDSPTPPDGLSATPVSQPNTGLAASISPEAFVKDLEEELMFNCLVARIAMNPSLASIVHAGRTAMYYEM